ncbi:hypothetical protein [Bradyrhizobium sp.]|uniref:hypothetical protein n=1 Tax=Bradyrhizobium sp. TaxID=376 RepID=UPI0025C6F576|nr:hypothetical protein [Bradyrhizobium sp.]
MLATVDRLVDHRESVRAKTAARVEAAVNKSRLLRRSRGRAARAGQGFRFAIVLPTGSNSFMIATGRFIAIPRYRLPADGCLYRNVAGRRWPCWRASMAIADIPAVAR